MTKQEQFDRSYLEMARVWAKNSYCTRRKVGALLVKDRMIISDGFNGTPAGFENICEDPSDRCSVRGVLQTDNSGWYQESGLHDRVQCEGWYRAAAPGRNRSLQIRQYMKTLKLVLWSVIMLLAGSIITRLVMDGARQCGQVLCDGSWLG